MSAISKRSPRRIVSRRVALTGTAVLMTAATAAGLTATPAAAARHDTCATARAVFRAHMNEARFWLNAADTLAAAGSSSLADLATAEAYHFMGLAENALGDMEGSC
jgi:ABC-type phosphate transport system substrate-binding protein